MTDSKRFETTPSFEDIKEAMKASNISLQNRRYNDDSTDPPIVPYFLYVITQNEKGELISMALGDDPSKYNITDDSPVEPVVIKKTDDRTITDVINQHISEPLQQLYNTSSGDESSHVDDPSSTSSSNPFKKAASSHDDDSNLFRGGSRSRKYRRRHRKKNKNTKRRSRK